MHETRPNTNSENIEDLPELFREQYQGGVCDDTDLHQRGAVLMTGKAKNPH